MGILTPRGRVDVTIRSAPMGRCHIRVDWPDHAPSTRFTHRTRLDYAEAAVAAESIRSKHLERRP